VIVKAPKGKKSYEWKFVFWSFFLLGFGDIFHLMTRTIIFFDSMNFAEYGLVNAEAFYDLPETQTLFGIGLIGTGITVQLFYVGMYYYWRAGEVRRALRLSGKTADEVERNFFKFDFIVIASTLARFVLMAYPGNKYGIQSSELNPFRILSNIPLYVIGILVIILFFKRAADKGNEDIPGFSAHERNTAKKAALWIMVSYFCYSLTVFLSWWNPLFGMAMIPKTIAYLIVLLYFYKDLLVNEVGLAK
jgi:hypothetical protein